MIYGLISDDVYVKGEMGDTVLIVSGMNNATLQQELTRILDSKWQYQICSSDKMQFVLVRPSKWQRELQRKNQKRAKWRSIK